VELLLLRARHLDAQWKLRIGLFLKQEKVHIKITKDVVGRTL
jgi:hypothetical protein